jgi:hypothetical protein
MSKNLDTATTKDNKLNIKNFINNMKSSNTDYPKPVSTPSNKNLNNKDNSRGA